MGNETPRVDVLASLDREIERAGGEAYPVGRKLVATRDAVAELIEAVTVFERNIRMKYGDDSATGHVSVRNALARVGGAA